jgi:hypothetical protein
MFYRNFSLTDALAELLDSGLRAFAKGFTVRFKDRVYAVYIVKYVSTLNENRRGEWN